MQRLKIDVLKFTGAKRFTAKDGTEHIAIPVAANNIYLGEKGAYLEITLHENKDGPSQYGDDGFASVDLGKERREAGENSPIVGNWKHIGQKAAQSGQQPRQQQRQRPPLAATDDSLDEPEIDF